MILFEKGLEIKDEIAALIGDQAFIESELSSYLKARANAGLIQLREQQAKDEAKEFVKVGDISIKKSLEEIKQ